MLFQMEAPPLSPFPHIKQQPGSPRRISQQHSIYVSPHKNGSGLTPRSALLYKFNGSPSKVTCSQTLLQNGNIHVKNWIPDFQLVIFNHTPIFCKVTANKYKLLLWQVSCVSSWGSLICYDWHCIGGVCSVSSWGSLMCYDWHGIGGVCTKSTVFPCSGTILRRTSKAAPASGQIWGHCKERSWKGKFIWWMAPGIGKSLKAEASSDLHRQLCGHLHL